MAQYRQRVDESVWVGRPSLIPGLRGAAYPIPSEPDLLTEKPIGPIYEINRGYPWVYVPQRMKTFVPRTPVLNVYVNGNYIKPYAFKSQRIAEIGVRECS